MTPIEALGEAVIEVLEIEKGGLKGIPKDAPANQHHYFVNEVMDHETEEIIIIQHLNFEEKLNDVMSEFLKYHTAEIERIIGNVDIGTSTHGNCCTCTDCKYPHDECRCEANGVIRSMRQRAGLESQPLRRES